MQLYGEMATMEDVIAKERCMVNAIEDEMSRKINVHRWRTLEVRKKSITLYLLIEND